MSLRRYLRSSTAVIPEALEVHAHRAQPSSSHWLRPLREHPTQGCKAKARHRDSRKQLRRVTASEERIASVALRKDRVGQRPVDAELGIVPSHAARELGLVGLGHLVEDFAYRRPASESRARSPSARRARGGSRRSAPRRASAARRRILAQIDDHVPDRAARAAHDLRLLVRRGLVVQPAQRAAAAVPRDVALDDAGSSPCARNSSWQNERAKNPRSSSTRSSSTTNAPASGVGVNFNRAPAPRGSAPRTARPRRGCRPSARRSRPSGSTAGSARSRAASRAIASGARIGMCTPGRKRPCLCGLRSTVYSMRSLRMPQ